MNNIYVNRETKSLVGATQSNEIKCVQTPFGVEFAMPGDFILRTTEGDTLIAKEKIFVANYMRMGN